MRADKNLVSLVVGMNFNISPHKTFFLEHINQSMLKKKGNFVLCFVRSSNGQKKINE